METEKPYILYVDDEKSNLEAFVSVFRREYHVLTATTALEGLDILKREPIEIVLTDQRMPAMTGVQFLERVIAENPYPIRMIVTAYTDIQDVIEAINTGKVFAYINKPWNENEVKQILDGAIQLYRLDKKNRELIEQLQKNDLALRKLTETLEEKVMVRTQELEALQEELLVTAHQAGMADVAANVIHNAGNVLNSINVSVSLLTKKIRTTKLAYLEKCSEMFQTHKEDIGTFITKDPKGSCLPDYIQNLAEYWKKEHEVIVDELGLLDKNIQYLTDIILVQQSLCGNFELEQPVDLESLINDSLKMCAINFKEHHITVNKDLGHFRPVLLNRIKIIQILINLILNAKEALAESNIENKTLSIKASLVAEETIKIDVSDNGVGISPEKINLIFTHGFTTKKNGHGFGLHSASLAAKELHGALTVHSEGIGKGATFSLELPYKIATK